MSRPNSVLVSHVAARAPAPRKSLGFATVAAGAATFLICAAAVAADEPDVPSDRGAVSDTAIQEIPPFPETKPTPEIAETVEAARPSGAAQTRETAGASASGSAPTPDRHHKADAKARKASATAEAEPDTKICSSMPVTGTRLRKQVCTSAAQQQVDDQYQSQLAQDYLKRLSEQGTIAPTNPSAYIQSGIPGL